MMNDNLHRTVLVMSAMSDFEEMTDEDKLKAAKEWLDFIGTITQLKGQTVAYVFSVVHHDPEIGGISGRTIVGGSGQTLMFLQDTMAADLEAKLEESGVCSCQACHRSAVIDLANRYRVKDVTGPLVPGPETMQ